MTMKHVALGIALSVAAAGTVRASDSDEAERVRAATVVLDEMMDASDQAIPPAMRLLVLPLMLRPERI